MQNAGRDTSTKSKRANKRRNSRKKSLSPSSSKGHSAPDAGADGKRSESKRSLSEAPAKPKNRKSNIRRTHTHPPAEILLSDLDRYRGNPDKDHGDSTNDLEHENANHSESRNEVTNETHDRVSPKVNEPVTYIKPDVDSTICNGVLSDINKIKSANEHIDNNYFKVNDKLYVNSSIPECLNPSGSDRGMSPHKVFTDESISDDSTFVLEITSSDRDTEDERRSYYDPGGLTFDILNDEIQAMFKERFQRLGEELAASTMKHQGFDFAKMFSERTADPIIKYAREQIAQDFNNCRELESLAMSTLRRVSVRRKRRGHDFGSGAAEAERAELDAGRMQPEDYKLVFISSDSSSREEEPEETGGAAGPGADGAWDYWEAGGRWRRPRRARRCARAGRACRCGAAPRVLAVPVPVPIPVPAALWPALLGPARDNAADSATVDARARPQSAGAERLERSSPTATMTVAATGDSPRLVADDDVDAVHTTVEELGVPEPSSSSADSGDDSDCESQHSASFSRVFVVNPSDWSSGEDDADGSAPSDEDSSGDCVLLRYSGPDANGNTVEVINELPSSVEDRLQPIEHDSLDAGSRPVSDESQDQTSNSGAFQQSGTDVNVTHHESAPLSHSATIIETSANHKNCVNFIKFCDLNMLNNNFDEFGQFIDSKQSDSLIGISQAINSELSVSNCDILSSEVITTGINILRTTIDLHDSADEPYSEISLNCNDLKSNNNNLKDVTEAITKEKKQCGPGAPYTVLPDYSTTDEISIKNISNDRVNLNVALPLKGSIHSEEIPKLIENTENNKNILSDKRHDPVNKFEGNVFNEDLSVSKIGDDLSTGTSINYLAIPPFRDTTTDSSALRVMKKPNAQRLFAEARTSMLPLLEKTQSNKDGELDLVRGIERTLSELLIKETISSAGARETEGARTGGGPTGGPAVSWSRSPRADVARYTSRVMITQELSSPQPVSAPARITVQHANGIADNDDIEESNKVEFGGGVSVITDTSTLSAVVCLEEGLADDDSWVEEGSRGSPSDLSDSDSGDEVEFHRDDGEYAACRRSALDFTLHTIVEESCEESECDRVLVSRPSSATELEKYFFYGLADGRRIADDDEDVHSETSSARSEVADSISGGGDADAVESTDPEGLASSRLERYFLTGFMGFSQERRDSDGSGSVGSDSEGRRSPARRKRLVRPRGSERLDGELPTARLDERISSSDEAEKDDTLYVESSPNTGSLDAQHRKKQSKKRRNSPADERRYSLEARDDHMEDVRSVSDQDDGRQTPRPEFLPVNSELANCKKQTSRDSGFVGSCDDLLKSSDSHVDVHTVKNPDMKLDLEGIAEENRQDFDEKQDGTVSMNGCASNTLIRKDSFNNWSSDEETNLMMSKMRQFFKSMVAASANAQHAAAKQELDGKARKGEKPAQLAHFESELTRLMKTVPGIRDEEVREIVEYLSSEDAWSDSYDSSDYTGSDMESAASGRSALRKQISDSCREIIVEFDRGENGPSGAPATGDADCVYRKLVASLGDSSPPLAAKVIQHIGSRLVALMHEVSAGSAEEGDDAELQDAPRRLGLGRSRSHDVLGGGSSVPRAAPDIIDDRDASDNERFSWRGSFESALLAEPSPGALVASLAAAGSGERLERVRSLGALTAGAGAGATSAGSLPRLAVKSARHRAAAAGPSLARGRAASAPGLAVLQGQRRRRAAHAPPSAITATASADDICSSDLYSGINSPANLRSSSPIPSGHSINHSGSQDNEDDISRLVAMHNRSGLQARCESLASVYSGAGEGIRGSVVVRGAVQFALLYNYRLGSLDVVVKRCQDLAPVDTKRNKSDPYVKVYLLPDKSKGGKRKTRVRKGTLQPVWDETLRFSAPLAALASRTLWLSVWHADLLGRNDFLGEVRLPLANRTFDDTQPQWYTLQERTEHFDDNQGSKGDLIVALKFELPDHVNASNLRAKGTLHVLVKEAKNLCASKTNGLADAFCKSYLLPERSRAAKQKTAVVRRSLNPKWEHCFSYSGISAGELRGRALELSVWDRDRFSSNDFMGGVRFSLGTGVYGGAAVEWMDSTGREVSLWETMLQRHNFWVEGSLALRPSLSN